MIPTYRTPTRRVLYSLQSMINIWIYMYAVLYRRTSYKYLCQYLNKRALIGCVLWFVSTVTGTVLYAIRDTSALSLFPSHSISMISSHPRKKSYVNLSGITRFHVRNSLDLQTVISCGGPPPAALGNHCKPRLSFECDFVGVGIVYSGR